MNKSNRHNLIAILASLIAVVMIFGMAVVLGGDLGAYVGNNGESESESFDNIYDSSEDTKVESTGWLSGNTAEVKRGKEITTLNQLKEFVSGTNVDSTVDYTGATEGYLANDILGWSLGIGVSTYTMSSSKTLYGNGHTVYLSANSTKGKNGTNFTDQGGDIGLFLQKNEGNIYNVNFIFTGTFYNQNGSSTWIGPVAGRNEGIIQDVSVELQGPMLGSRAKEKTWGQIGGIVGYNSGQLNNVSFNLNTTTELKSHDDKQAFTFGSYNQGAYDIRNRNHAYAIAGGIAGENDPSGVISGCTVKTTNGSIEVRDGGYCNKRVAKVCANNNGSVYGIVLDGDVKLDTGSESDKHVYTNGGIKVDCGIDVNGADNSVRDLSTSSGFTWDWYFTGTGANTIFHYRKAGVASGEYVYNSIVGTTTNNVASSKVKEATFGMDQEGAVFNLEYFYDCVAYADYTSGGKQYYFYEASEGDKSFSFVYDANAVPEVSIKYYRLDDNGNRASTPTQTISKQQASLGSVSVQDNGIGYDAGGTRNYVAATNKTFTLTVVPRNVYVEMPDFIYNKSTGQYYDATGTPHDVASSSAADPTGGDVFNKIYAAISCDSNPGYDSTTVQTVNSTTHPGATAISSASDLIAFLNKTTTGDIGYLTTNISITSSDLSGNYYNNAIAQGTKFVLESGSQLYGNGKTITLTYANSSEWGGNNTKGTVSTFIKENYGLIRDINYTFAGSSIAGLGGQESYLGLFVGQNASSGEIRNVSVTNTGFVRYHMVPSGYKFYAGVAVGRNDGLIARLSVTMNSSSGNNAFEIAGPGSGEAYCGGVVGINNGNAYALSYTYTNGRLRAASQGSYGNATNFYISTICPNNAGNIYGMTLNNVTQTKVGLNASSSIVSFGTATTAAYLDYYSINSGDTAVSSFNYGVGYNDGISTKLPLSYFTNIMDALKEGKGYIKSGDTIYNTKEALINNNIGKYDYCNDDLAGAYGTFTINVINTANYYIVGDVIFDFGTYYHKQDIVSDNESVANYTYSIYEKQYHGQSNSIPKYGKTSNSSVTVSSEDNSWLTLDGSNYDTAIKNHSATSLTPWTPVAVLNTSRLSVNNGIVNSSQACGLNIIDLITYDVDTTIYVSKVANSLNVYDLSTTPYTANVTWTYGATSDGDPTPTYTFTIECDQMDTLISLKYYANYTKFAVAGNPSNVVVDKLNSGNFSISISAESMDTYYGANNEFDFKGLHLYDVEANTDTALKAFLAGNATTSRLYAGAQKLTLTGDVTISSALSSAVVFNQYKTLDGAGHTITINTPTGADYASTTGTTYSTPGYPTNVTGYQVHIYRGGLAAVSLGTFQDVNIVLGGNNDNTKGALDVDTSDATIKSYAVGGVVGLNQGGSFNNVKVTVVNNQTIGAHSNPAVWGTLIGISSGGSIQYITIGGDRNKTITNNSGDATYRSYIGGVVGVMKLIDNENTYRNMRYFMADPENESKVFGTTELAKPSAFKNIYNMYMGSYVGTNAFKGLVTGASYISGATPSNFDIFNNIVFFNKSESAVPFFSLTAGKHDARVVSAYGALGDDDKTAITLDNRLMQGVGITLKYDSYNDRAGDGSSLEVLDMLDYTISGTSIYFNRANSDIRNLRLAVANSAVSGVTSGNDACVTFNNSDFSTTSSTANTNQITAVLTMTLAVTTASGLNDFLKDVGASDPLMAIINGIDLESGIKIEAWSNFWTDASSNVRMLKVDARRTLNGNGNTVTMNLTSTNKAYADYSSSDNWNGYKLVYDFIGVNDGTIQNLKFVGQVGNFSSYSVSSAHIIGSLVAVNNGTINGVTYTNNGIGRYNNDSSAGVTVAGLVAGVNMGDITNTQVFNRAVFSVVGMFGLNTSAAMGAIAGVNDGGYATGVKVFGDNAIELVSKTAKDETVANNNTALYVGGVFGVASNDGAVSFATKTIGNHDSNAVISNANVIVAGGMGIRYSVGGAINLYGSRGIFAGIVTSNPTNTQPTMSDLAFMDMQTNPNLANYYVTYTDTMGITVTLGVGSDRVFNNSLKDGTLSMMGYYNYVDDNALNTSCVVGGKLDILDRYDQSVFMYMYDETTNNDNLLAGLRNYMNGKDANNNEVTEVEIDLQNVSNYLRVNIEFAIRQTESTFGDILKSGDNGLNYTVLQFLAKKDYMLARITNTNNVVPGSKYKFIWSIDPSRNEEKQSNIIQGFIEGQTSPTYKIAGAALSIELSKDAEVTFTGMSAGRVLDSDRSISGIVNDVTLTVNVDMGTNALNITEANANYAVGGYDVVGVGGLFGAVLGTISNINIVVNITGGTVTGRGINMAVGGIAGIVTGNVSINSAQVNYNDTTIAFDDGGKTISFGGLFGNIKNTTVTLNQVKTNYVYMKGVTIKGYETKNEEGEIVSRGTAQNVAVGGAVGLMQNGKLQGGANPTVLYLSSLNRLAGTQGFDVTSTISFSGTGGLGGLVGIMAGSTLQNINIDQGMSFADYTPSNYLWTGRDMVWTLNGGSGSAVSAMGGAVGVSFGGIINAVGVNSRARLINNVDTTEAGDGITEAGDTTYNYIGGLLGLGSNGNGMSLTGTSDAYTETINGETYILNFTKINNIYAGQIGMIAMPDGGYAGYVTGRYINDTTAYGDNLRNLVWIDFTRKQADLFSKIQVFGATNSAGITLSNVAGMSVLGYVPIDKYNTLIQGGYNKSGREGDSKMASYSKITASDFQGRETSLALSVYLAQDGSVKVKLLGTMTANGYKPFTTGESTAETQQIKSWTYNVYAADGKTAFFDTKTYNSEQYDVLARQSVYAIGNFAKYDSGDRHNYFRIQIFCDEKIIETEAQLKAFISSNDSGNSSLTGYANASVGVLGANITLNQEPNQYAFAKTLYGAGYTITIKAQSNATNATIKAQNKVYYANSAGATGNKTVTDFDVSNTATPVKGEKSYIYGLFVAHISSAGGIYDTNFAFDQQFYIVTYGQIDAGTRPTDNNYKDETESMVAGIVCAVNSGVIQNCTLNLGAKTEFVVNRSFPLNTNRWPYPANNMCIAGGFAAISVGATKSNENNHAYINNCTLNMDNRAIMRSICEARRVDNIYSYAFPKAQSMVGGMVGWLGEQAHIFNSTLNGGGLLEATTNTRIRFATAGESKYEKQDYLRANTYASGAGALVGVNTTSYSYTSDADQGENDKQPYTNMASIEGKNVRGEIDGVIINWSGFTMEAICESYRGWQGQVLGTDPSSKETGISYGYRQIAGICDWSTIRNAYLVSYKASGNTGAAMKDSNGNALTKNYQVGNSSWNVEYAYPAWEMDLASSLEYCYKSLVLKANMSIPTRYVGRGGDTSYETTEPAKQIYLYKNTTSSAADKDVVELEKLDDTVSLSWELVDASMGVERIKNATLSFDFEVPTSSGGFLWDVQAYIEKPTTLYERARNEDGTDRAGWQEVAGKDGLLHWIDTTTGTKLLFYNDVYNKINSMSDAYKYADVSQTFSRGNNVYLYYSYGTTGSASIDKTRYYYDATKGVYYDKYTTSFGNNFNMPALAFFDAQGNRIENSSISSTIYRGLEVYRLTTNDPNSVTEQDKINALTYYDKLGGVINDPSTSNSIASVGLNDPVAGSYRISFNTESNASIGSAIKDIPSKTIIFPDDKMLSGNFKVVEIVTPLGLRAKDMTFILECKGNVNASQLDVMHLWVGQNDVISEQFSTYEENINKIKPTSFASNQQIGKTDVTINLEDWKYYGYSPTANGGQGGLDENRTYLIAGSGFSLEYDFSEDATNDGITVNASGTQATLSDRGLIIPTAIAVGYVQKTYDGNVNAGTTTKFTNAITGSTISGTPLKFVAYDNANAGNGKNMTINVGRITFEGYKYKIDRYYDTTNSQYGMRAASAQNSNNTIDNWKNSSTVESSPKTSHQFANNITSGTTGTLTVKGIGTILPKEVTINYIAKEYDGNKGIKYSQTSGYSTAVISHSLGGVTLQPKAKFKTANVVYSGLNNYNDIVFTVMPIKDQTNGKYRYAFVDSNNNNNIYNYGIGNTNGVTEPNNPAWGTTAELTLAKLGIIVPQTVSITKVKKIYDASNKLKAISNTLDNSHMIFELSKTSFGNATISAKDLGITDSNVANIGTFASSDVNYSSNIGINLNSSSYKKFELPSTLSTYNNRYYDNRYFVIQNTNNSINYAVDNTTYKVGIIVPMALEWQKNGDLKDVVFKTYDNKVEITGISASNYLNNIVLGDAITPTIKFNKSDVDKDGVGFTMNVTQKTLDGTPYYSVDGCNNYCIANNAATGMILPRAVTFKDISKVYDGDDTLTSAIYSSMKTEGSVDNVKLNPVGTYIDRHAGIGKTITWTSSGQIKHGVNTYNLLQERSGTGVTQGPAFAGNYYVDGNTSTGDITPYKLVATDFTVSVVQKNGKTEPSQTGNTGDTLGFTYFAGAVYVVSVAIRSNQKHAEDALTAELSVNGDGATPYGEGYNCNAGTYAIKAEELGGAYPDNYTLASKPLDLGIKMTVAQQEVTNVAITVMPKNVDYDAELPTATANGWSAKDNVTGGEISGVTFGIIEDKYQWVNDSGNAASKGSPIGGYNLSVTGITMTGNNNYKLAASATYTVTVTPSGAKALYILPLETTLHSVEKEYDGDQKFTASTTFKKDAQGNASPLGNAFVGQYENKNVQGYNDIAMGNVKVKLITFKYYDKDGKEQTKYVIATVNVDKMSNYYLAATPAADGYATLQVGVITPKEVSVTGEIQITQYNEQNGKTNAEGPASSTRFEYFNGAKYRYSATLTGFIPNDEVSISIRDNCSGEYNVGTYNLSYAGLQGKDSGNYEFKGTINAKLVIIAQTLNKNNVLITVKPINVVYGTAIDKTNIDAVVTAIDNITGIGVEASFSVEGFDTDATANSKIGGYDITIDSSKVILTDNGNYVIGSYTIVPTVDPNGANALYIIPADARINRITKTYDGTPYFTGATFDISVSGITVNGQYDDKNVGTDKVHVNVATFNYYSATESKYVDVDIFPGSNYKVANAHTTNASVATIDGVGFINPYTITSSDITGVVFRQEWRGKTTTGETVDSFEYGFSAVYAVDTYVIKKLADDDNYTLQFAFYKQNGNLAGTTGLDAGTYTIKITAIDNQTPASNYRIDQITVNGATMTITRQIIEDANVYATADHAWITYDENPHGYSIENIAVYVTDKDGREVIVSGAASNPKVDGVATQTAVGNYPVTVDINISGTDKNYSFNAVSGKALHVSKNGVPTKFAIIPMKATLNAAYKEYDGTTSISNATMNITGADGKAIKLADGATLSAYFKSADVNVNGGYINMVFSVETFSYYADGKATTKTTVYRMQTTTTTGTGEEQTTNTATTNYYIGDSILYGSTAEVSEKAYITPKEVTITAAGKVYDGTAELVGDVTTTGTIDGASIAVKGKFYKEVGVEDCNVGDKMIIFDTYADFVLNNTSYLVLKDGAGKTTGKDCASNYYIATNNLAGTISPRVFTSADVKNIFVERLLSADATKDNVVELTEGGKVTYTSKYKYNNVFGNIEMKGATFDNTIGDWVLKLYRQDEPDLDLTVEFKDENGNIIDGVQYIAQNAGTYTVTISLSGHNYVTNTPVSRQLIIIPQVVEDANNIFVYMNSFDGEYGKGNFKSPNASDYDYRIRIVDRDGGDTVEFIKGGGFVITSLAFSRDADGTPADEITPDANDVYIGAYYLFAASVKGSSDNFIISDQIVWNYKKIYGIGKEAIDINQSMYYITPAEFKPTSVTKFYDGTTDTDTANNQAEFVYNGDKTEALCAKYDSHMSTHSANGSSVVSGANRIVNFKTSVMNVATSKGSTDYAIALKADGTTFTNYYIGGSAVADAEGYIAVDGVAVIKKYMITDGVMTLEVEGYVEGTKELQRLSLDKNNTPDFVYAYGYVYDGTKFTVTGLQLKQGGGLFNKSDKVGDMKITINGEIKNAGTHDVKLGKLEADNYEMTPDTILGQISIARQVVTEDRVIITIPYLTNVYDGTVQKPESSDKFKFTVNDYYTEQNITSDASDGGGLSAFKYYKDDYKDGASTIEPKDIGRYSVSVVVDTSFIDTLNYVFENNKTEITKFAQEGKAVYFILPKALTVTNVTKQYDGNANFVDIQVNGVKADSVADPKTIITIDEGGFVAADNTVETKNAVYNAIIAAGGRFDSKDIAETVSEVSFNARTFSYRTTVDGVTTDGTAYYIYDTTKGVATNYMVPRASVGYITPAHLTITGMTKTYDGTTALQFEYSYDSNTKVGINKTTESVTDAMMGEVIRPAGEYTSADVTAVDTKIDVKFNVTEMVIDGVTYYRLVNNAKPGGKSNASNYYIFTSNDSVTVVDGMITVGGIGIIKAIAISDGTTGTTADASISNITIDGKAYDSTSAFIYNYSKSYGIADLKATFKFFGGELTCQGEYDSTKGLMKVEGIKGDTLYFSITFKEATEATFAKNAGKYDVKIKLIEIDSTKNNAYEFGTAGVLTLSKEFKINQYQLKQDELKIYVAALERPYDGKEGIITDGVTDVNTWVENMVYNYTITFNDATITSTLTIHRVKKTNDTQEFINVGAYALQAQVRGYSDTNYTIGNDVYYNLYRQADQNAGVFQILPKKITLETETVVEKNFDGTVSYLFNAGVAGEQVLLGNTAIAGEYARAGVHTLENTTFNVLDVVLDPTVNGFNSTLYNEETKVLDKATAKGNYEVVGTTTYKLTINPSNIVVAERRYNGTNAAEIEVAITGLAGMQFINNNIDEDNNTVDKTALADVLKISVNSFASFEKATAAEINDTPRFVKSTDKLGYVTYTIIFTYRAKGTLLDDATYTDRYVFAVAGKESGYSTNLALTSSELADGQMAGTASTTGTPVATAEALVKALKDNNANICLTANIYGWDASAIEGAVNYTHTLFGNGYSIQLAGGLNSDKEETNGGAFIAGLSGKIQDVNFKFTSAQTLGANTIGLVVGNMTGNMTNVSLDIINTPTFDKEVVIEHIGGLAGTASGSMTNATVIFNASVDNDKFGGLVGSATNATFKNVSVRAYNGNKTTGKTLVATATNCKFNGVIDMIGKDLGVSGITNLYTVNTSLTTAKAYGKLELLTPHTEGFIEYYFTTTGKTGGNEHNKYTNGADERDKTMYQTYGTPSGTVLAIETLAPRDRFIWEAYSHNYQTEVTDENGNKGHINLSLNRYVAMMPIGTVIEANGYTLDGQSKTDMSFITAGVTMFCPAIGIRGGQEVAASGSTIKEAVYTGEVIEHSVTITETKEDGTKTEKKVIVSATDVGYYDNIVVELKGDVTTDDINYDTSNRTAIVAAIGDGTNVAGAILIIYPKQTELGDNFSKTYDTTSIGEFTTTVDGKSVTLLGTYVDAQNEQGKEASDVDVAKWVSFANNSNAVRKVLVDKNGNYIAQHHKTDANGTTYSYTKILIEKNGIDVVFNKDTTLDGVTNDALMKAMAQLINYDKATSNDAALKGNANYTNAWVYNVTARGYTVNDTNTVVTFNNGDLYYVPETINDNAGNFTFTANGLTAGRLNKISTTEPSAFAVFAGTTSSNASITPAQREATYTIVNADKLSFRMTHTKDTVKVAVKTWNLSTYESTHKLPTQMTAKQRDAFSDFMSRISADDVDTLSLMSAESGSKIIDNGGTYSIAYTASDKYFAFKLPTTITKDDKDATAYGNYVIVPDSKVIEFRYFIVNANGEFELSTYKDVLMIGERAVVDIDGTQYESNYHKYAYEMTGNINMKSSLITPFDWGNGTAFAGSIDGAGFALTNYILKGKNNVGLFANMASGASVTNLVMGNVMVVATASSGEVNVSALTANAAEGATIDVATEMRVVTNTAVSVELVNAGQSFVRVHKQSGSNVTISTLLNGKPKNDYLKPSDIDTLTKFGNTTSERVTNFLNNYVFNNAKLTYNYNSTAGTLSVNVNNFREYWGWYNICPWLEGLNVDGKTWNGIRPTKTNEFVPEKVEETPAA